MSSAVLDASVLLALIRGEMQDGTLFDLLPDCVMSTVNLAEVLTRVSDLGLTTAPMVYRLLGILEDISPFTVRQAQRAAQLRQPTRHAGLSLGDRACLALALDLGLPAYTVDRNWMRVDVGCRIHCLR